METHRISIRNTSFEKSVTDRNSVGSDSGWEYYSRLMFMFKKHYWWINLEIILQDRTVGNTIQTTEGVQRQND